MRVIKYNIDLNLALISHLADGVWEREYAIENMMILAKVLQGVRA